jgi:hypothetical protein
MKTVVNLESGSSDGSTSLVMYGSEEDCVEYAFPLRQNIEDLGVRMKGWQVTHNIRNRGLETKFCFVWKA